MPIEVGYAGTVSGGSFALPAGPVSLTAVLTDGVRQIAVSDEVFAGTEMLGASGAGLSRTGDPAWHEPAARVALTVNGEARSLPDAVIATALGHLALGGGNGQSVWLAEGGRAADRGTVAAADVGGATQLFVAAATGAGLTGYVLNGTGAPGTARPVRDTDGRYLDQVADLAVIKTSGGTYLYAGSSSEAGLTGFRVGADARLSEVEFLGREESLPVQTVSGLAAAHVAGRDFLVVAASGSSSLTVLRVRADGSLGPTDHVFDGRDTRFQGVAQIETVQVGGQAFVIAAGADEGMTVFRLSPDGRLIHEDTLVETGSGALNDPVDIAALVTGAEARIVTRGEGQAGAGVYTMDLGAAGDVARVPSGTRTGTSGSDLLQLTTGAGTLEGGAGADVLIDGPGSDRLRGGAGRDTFVLIADGEADTILDATPGQDVIDLSGWPFLYSLDAVAVTPTDSGATLRFGDEVLHIRSAAGGSLSVAQVERLVPAFLNRAEIVLGPLQQAAPELAPEPFPDTVPPPIMPANGGGIATDPGDFEDLPGTIDEAGPIGSASGVMVDGTDGADTLSAGDGDDTVLGRGGNDVLSGGAGDDTIAAADGADRADGGSGNDMIGGGTGNDTLFGGTGRDTLGGGRGEDSLDGGDGADVLAGGPGNDVIEGGVGNDTIGASYGNDQVRGAGGDDDIGGGTGRDILSGGNGDDRLGGGEGDDTVKGGAGADFVAGGGRNDRLEGGAGADTLNGGVGNDVFEGGGGADVFVFTRFTDGERDVIEDFTPGVDLMRLSGIPGRGAAGKFAALTIEAVEDGTGIFFGGHTIIVEDMTPDAFNPEDFLFL
ncbi:hypothetical protein LVO79_17185 [Roseivivax marinus]|uniref:hypothetical protein n=1 Tax=Roseivivax marinus TaxID=1379903 RepID=UPI001F03EA32|nr:hypothetical protein [Roseivivax marinus]UMA64711.1 hypothetical protein LVO79_17185 [Roseivivax marinus]